MQIIIEILDTENKEMANTLNTVAISLADNPTSRDLYSQLPLTLKLENYANNEKIVRLNNKLTTQGAPNASTAKLGQLCYYAPWGNLALFYQNLTSAATGLIYLGDVMSDKTQLASLPQTDIVIRRA